MTEAKGTAIVSIQRSPRAAKFFLGGLFDVVRGDRSLCWALSLSDLPPNLITRDRDSRHLRRSMVAQILGLSLRCGFRLLRKRQGSLSSEPSCRLERKWCPQVVDR